jgi:hypothetical protein
MSTELALTPISEPEYEAIESAVMETERGRWFLKEYFRRNRNADTNVLLEAIARLEQRMETRKEPAENSSDIKQMAETIEHAQMVIGQSFEEVLDSSERALANVEEAIERIQEAAWSLREEGAPEPLCDDLDRHASDIHNACQFQERASQRLSKMVTTLRHLEERIHMMSGKSSPHKHQQKPPEPVSEFPRPFLFPPRLEHTLPKEEPAGRAENIIEEPFAETAEPYLVESSGRDKNDFEADIEALKQAAAEMESFRKFSIFSDDELVFVDSLPPEQEQQPEIVVSKQEETVEILQDSQKLDDPFFINISEYDLLAPRERMRRFT